MKSPKKEANYSQKLFTLVQTIYNTYKGLYGSERIMEQIYIDTGKLFNIKTFYRYMKHLGVGAKIRNPIKEEGKQRNQEY